MSTTVTPQSPPLGEPEQADDLYGEVGALCQLVRLGQGRFTLALVEYDLPRACAKVIADIHGQFPDLNIVEAELSPPPPDAPLSYNVLDQLKHVVQATSPDTPPDVLILSGLEILFPPSSPTDNGHMSDELRRAIQPLNLGRNILAEMFPCPVLLFLPKAAMEVLLTSAPDIVSWKSGFFVFDSELEKVKAEIDREADAKINWKARLRLRRLTFDELTLESKRLTALIADARMLPAEPTAIARLHNRLGWTAAALGDSTLAQQSFAEMLRLARCENDTKLIKVAEKGLRRAAKLQRKWSSSLKRSAITQQSFRGAAALSKADELFGRETELQELLLQVNRVGNRFVTVWGETGCGKTSLVLAGVVPELEKQGHLSVVVREWDHPVLALRSALEEKCGLSLQSTDSLRVWLQAAAQKTGKTIVIVSDQFEQFFTKHPNRQEREPLLKEIGACLNDFRLPSKFIFILREDYLGRMVELEKYVADALDRNKRFYLSLFDQATALRVMRQLSDKARLNWPDVFLNEVIKDLTQDGQVRPIELQLAGAALATLAINDEQAYSRAGRAEGLLTDYLQATLESVSASTRELKTLKRVLLALIEEPYERLSLTAEEIAARSEISLDHVLDKLNKLISVNLVRRHAEFQENGDNKSAPVFLYELMHDVLVDSVLRLTRDLQDKRRQAKKMLTRALEDIRVKPRHTVNLRGQRLLRNYLPPKDKNDPKVKSLLKRSLFFGIVKLTFLGLIIPISLLTFVQSTFTHITLERDFNDRLVIRRGLPQLGFLPLIGDEILIDTGFSVTQIDPKKRSVVQGIYFWELDNRRGGAMAEKRFYESFGSDDSAELGGYLIKIGHKNQGLQQLLTTLKEDKYGYDKVSVALILATLIKADPSLAKPAFDALLPILIESNDTYKSMIDSEVADTLVITIKADPSLAKPAFDALFPILKEQGALLPTLKEQRNVDAPAMVLAAAVKADPQLAKPVFDALFPISNNTVSRTRGALTFTHNREALANVFAAVVKADPRFAKPTCDALLPIVKEEDFLFSYRYFDFAGSLAAAVKADPQLAKPVFDALFPVFKKTKYTTIRKTLAKSLAAAIKADPQLAKSTLDTLLSTLEENKNEDQIGREYLTNAVSEILEPVVKADRNFAKPAFNTLLRVFEEDKDSDVKDEAAKGLAVVIKADPQLARPAFDALLPAIKENKAGSITNEGTPEALAAAIKADPQLARPAFDTIISALNNNKESVVLTTLAGALEDCIAVNVEVRNMAASQLFTNYDSRIRDGMVSGFAKHLARLAREEAQNGRDPVQFLFDHLEGRRSLMPNGNANTYAIYRQVAVKAMGLWMASKKSEAVATQAALKQRLEMMRDHEARLHLRIAAWDTLAAAADSLDERDEDDFEDFDE